MIERRTPPGTPAWYEALTDDQLRTSLRALRPESREWLIVKQLTDDRGEESRRQRNLRLMVAGILFAILAAVAAAMALR